MGQRWSDLIYRGRLKRKSIVRIAGVEENRYLYDNRRTNSGVGGVGGVGSPLDMTAQGAQLASEWGWQLVNSGSEKEPDESNGKFQ